MEYERYRTIVEKAADYIYVIDKKNRLLSVNESAAELFGKTPKEIEGKSIFDIFPKEVATEYSKRLSEVFKTGKGLFDSDKRMVVGGKELWTSTRLDPITDREGDVLAVLGVSRDITERKRIEEALRHQTNLLRGVFDNAKGAIFILDAQNPPRILDCNRAASDIFGYEKSEMLGKTTVFLHVNNESLKQFQSLLYPTIEQGLSFQLQEFRMKRKDGSVFPSEHSVSQLLNDKGERTGWVSVVRDITERKRFEEELRDLASFPSENPNPTLRLDKHGIVLSANEASKALLQDWSAGIGQVAPKSWRDLVTDVLSSGETRNIDIEFGSKSYTFLVKPVGERDYLNLYGTDITDRKRAEESLKASELKYRRLFENIPHGIYQNTPDGRILIANPALVRMLGYDSASELLAADITRDLYVNPGDRNAWMSRLEQGGGELRNAEVVLKRKNGQELVALDSGHVVRDEQGRILYYEGTLTDITERKRMEEEHQRSSQFLKSIIENANVWLDVLDEEKNVVIWNKAAETISGYSRGEVVGHGKIWEWLYPHEKYRKQIVDSVTDVVHGRTEQDVETSIRRKDGETRVISWNERNLLDKNGKVIGSIAIGRDVTEQKQMQEELERYSKHLEESEEKLRALHRHALQLGSASNIEEIAESTLDAIEFALGFDVTDVYLVAGDSLRVRGTRGAPIGLSEEHLSGRGLVAKAARSQATVRVSDTTKEPDYVDRKGWDWTGPHTMLSELAVPVVVDAETVAVLNAESIRLDAFSGEDQRLLETLAAHVGSEMRRLKHGQELETYSKHLEELVEERTKRLLQSEERYRSIVQNIPGMVWTSSEKGDTVFITPNVKELYGYTPEEIYAGDEQAWSKHIHPDDRGKLNEAYNALFVDGRVFDVEYRYQRPDGKWVWLNDRADLVYEKDGVRYTDGVTTDITERKRMEEELRAARERLEYVVASNPAVLYLEKPLPDLSDTFSTFVSESATSVLGFEPKNFLGESGLKFWRSRIHPDDLARFWAEMPSLWSDGHHTFEYRFLHRDGTYRWIRDEYKVIRDAEGHILDIATVAIDVTERVKLYEKLARSERLAAIGETAAMVGHDLRNPLQGVALALCLLKQESLTAKERNEMLQLIQDNLEYADAIIRDLSDYSAEIKLELEEATPKSITRDAIEAVKVPGNITVQDLSENQPTLRVDPDRMRRVFINLIENAIDAMPQGGTLTTSSKQSNGTVEFGISDTGPGMPEKVMENLWKPLQTTKAKGMGLGLAICKRIVDAHGGTISVKSKAGEGTTVTISLPIKPETAEVT